MLFSRNIKRNGKGPQGNYVFRRPRKKLHVELKHRLELNPETDATRRQKRLRTAGVGAKIAMIFLCIMGLFSAGRIVIKEAFIDNARFHLQHFSVKTDGNLTTSQIVAASGLQEGINMLGVSLVKVREKLEALPEVKNAKVSRGYPGILFMEVEQRHPVAWLSCPDLGVEEKVAGYGVLLDADGFVLPSGELSDVERRLPVIQVAKLDRILPGQQIESSQVHAAIELLKAQERSKIEPALHLKRIDATKGFCITALYDNRVTVTFPSHDLDSRIERLGRVMAEARKQSWQLATVDLLVEQNVPVTFRSGGRTTELSAHSQGTRRALAATN